MVSKKSIFRDDDAVRLQKDLDKSPSIDTQPNTSTFKKNKLIVEPSSVVPVKVESGTVPNPNKCIKLSNDVAKHINFSNVGNSEDCNTIAAFFALSQTDNSIGMTLENDTDEEGN